MPTFRLQTVCNLGNSAEKDLGHKSPGELQLQDSTVYQRGGIYPSREGVGANVWTGMSEARVAECALPFVRCRWKRILTWRAHVYKGRDSQLQ